jgi:hypothetical protein
VKTVRSGAVAQQDQRWIAAFNIAGDGHTDKVPGKTGKEVSEDA